MRRSVVLLLLACAPLVAVSCGDDEDDAGVTLPPIRTTTSSSSTTTTTNPGERIFYEVKPGETLSIIARQFQVPLQAIIELNDIENPDAIAAGEVIEIPTGVVLVDELPSTDATTATDVSTTG